MCRQNEKKNRKQTPIKFLILDFCFFIAASLIRISQNRLAVYWTSGGAWVDRSRSCYKPINPPRSRAHPHYANFPFSKSNGKKRNINLGSFLFNIVLNCTRTRILLLWFERLIENVNLNCFFFHPSIHSFSFFLTIIFIRRNYQFNETSSTKRSNKKSCLKRLDLISAR